MHALYIWIFRHWRKKRKWIMFDFMIYKCSRSLRIERGGSCTVTLDIRSWFKNRTITVISSWKCRRTFLSIFLRSEYLISLFFAASWSAALISLLALPCNNRRSWAENEKEDKGVGRNCNALSTETVKAQHHGTEKKCWSSISKPDYHLT